MIYLTFNGKISSATVGYSKDGSPIRMFDSELYTFSKKKIFFDMKEEQRFSKALGGKIHIHYGDKYNLIRITPDDFYEYSKKSKFQIDINGERGALITDRWNGVKLRIVHERYWIQKNYDWLIKSLLYILFGAIVAYYFNNKGFDKGYSKGIENKQSDTLKSSSK